MPTISLKDALGAILGLLLLLFIAFWAWHLYDAGKRSQATSDQPKVTQAVVGEVASGVALGLNNGVTQSNTTRLTKAEETRKVSQAAQEALKDVIQLQPTPQPSGGGSMEVPSAPLAGDSSMGIPDSVADSYLSGLQRVRDSGSTGPTAFHKCSGDAGAWLICS